MAITALPQNTIRLLNSAQAIVGPINLVKELIDNSIDAQATSIEILISSNTLDKIEVRDNGHGIAEDDLDALGRRGHTSKLRTFEDLKSIGGVSLGFRGEALASAVQLGEVSVTTRTDGEAVASLVKLKTGGGGIASQTRISHPVGTTVSITKFMFKIPVRKQKLEAEATKTLAKVKELLQGYSLARLNVRFGLKVTKGGKGSWSFAPRPSDGVKEAVSQILGRNLAAQCIEKSLTFAEHHSLLENTSTIKDLDDQQETSGSKDKFIVEAFLPKPDADPSKIGYGQWISIDSRPVAHDKGTMRKMVTMFKYYIKGTLSGNGDAMKSPFLRLNIKCPESSYDPNIEPAKDNVLFGNESLVLDSIEGLFKSLYGDGNASSDELPQSIDVDETPDSFNLLLARKPPRAIITSPQATMMTEDGSLSNSSEGVCEATPASSNSNPLHQKEQIPVEGYDTEVPTFNESKCKWGFDMSKDYSEEVEGVSMPKRRTGGLGPSLRSSTESTKASNDLNPWLIAKMNAPVRENDNEPDLPVGNVHSPGQSFLPTPEKSLSLMVHSFGHPTELYGHNQPRLIFRARDAQAISIPPFLQHSVTSHPQHPSQSRRQQHSIAEVEDDELLLGDDSETYMRRTDFVSARHAPIPEDNLKVAATKLRKPRGPNKSFESPLRPIENPLSTDTLRQTTLAGNNSPQTDVPRNALQQERNEELAWAMEYENRKDSIMRRRRDELRAKRSEPEILAVNKMPQSSPHKNRYHAAIAILEGDKPSKENVAQKKESFRTTLPDGDARAYLMRRQKSMLAQTSKLGGPVKLTRVKSMRLPLETVHNQEQLHNVLLKLPTGMPDLHRFTTALAKSDTYVSRGTQATGLAMGALETTIVATRVEETVDRWMEADPENEQEVLFDFEKLINEKFTIASAQVEQ